VPEGVQEYESGKTVFYRVEWKSKQRVSGEYQVISLVRRTIQTAMNLAEEQKKRGFKTKLIRVEETELDF
jgi:hypothetical protein